MAIVCLTICSESCTKKKEKAKIELGFYYWKTGYSVQNKEQKKLNTLASKHLYLRFFDIVLKNNMPIPVAEIKFNSTPPKQACPTVFIKNEVFYQLKSPNDSELLATNTLKKIKSIASSQNIQFTEIQIDCDWSIGTQKAYFQFLRSLKKQVSSTLLSCTIRLHQIKFHQKTGIPPVDRGTLMVYNVGDWQSIHATNSLFKQDIIEQYTNEFAKYPLNLDLAFPIFGQVLLYRDSKFISFLKDVQKQELLGTKVLVESQQNNNFVSAADFYFKNIRIRKGDVLRYEEANAKEFELVVKWMIQNNRTRNFKLLFFDLNPINLAKITNEKITSIINQN